jgi:hypothetical protein
MKRFTGYDKCESGEHSSKHNYVDDGKLIRKQCTSCGYQSGREKPKKKKSLWSIFPPAPPWVRKR